MQVVRRRWPREIEDEIGVLRQWMGISTDEAQAVNLGSQNIFATRATAIQSASS
jgi:hypothetical protein